MKNADENELRSIASDPDDIHMYNVNDFKFLLDIVDDLSVNLCNSVKGPGEPAGGALLTVVVGRSPGSSCRSWSVSLGRLTMMIIIVIILIMKVIIGLLLCYYRVITADYHFDMGRSGLV